MNTLIDFIKEDFRSGYKRRNSSHYLNLPKKLEYALRDLESDVKKILGKEYVVIIQAAVVEGNYTPDAYLEFVERGMFYKNWEKSECWTNFSLWQKGNASWQWDPIAYMEDDKHPDIQFSGVHLRSTSLQGANEKLLQWLRINKPKFDARLSKGKV